MRPIALEEMDGIKLMNRIDTKFILPYPALAALLNEAAASYRVLSIEGERISDYSTLYFDTADIAMYRIHQHGKLVRQKIRTRTYLNSDESFLEIKNKNNRGRTKKKRIVIPREQVTDFSTNPEAQRFMEERSNYHIEELSPTLYTRFRRITLVSDGYTERLTIDTALSFENLITGHQSDFAELVIVEIKQNGLYPSEFREILRRHHIHPFRISKYCLGTATTNPVAPVHRIRWKVRHIEKLIKNAHRSC